MGGATAPIRHVILVVFDTLRRDAVGCYGTPPPWGVDRDAATRCVRGGVGPLRPRISGGAADALRAPDDLHGPAHLSVPQRRLSPHQGRLRRHRAGLGAHPGTTVRRSPRSYEAAGFRTGLISDLYHQFKPSKNFWRGFHQWTFIRGQEADAARSGPWPSQEEIDYWVPRELQELRGKATGLEQPGFGAHGSRAASCSTCASAYARNSGSTRR